MASSAVLSPGLNGGVAGLSSPSTRPPNQDAAKLSSRNTVHGMTPRKTTLASAETAPPPGPPAPLSSAPKKSVGGGSGAPGGGGGGASRQGGATGMKQDVTRMTEADGSVAVPECVRAFSETASQPCEGSGREVLSIVEQTVRFLRRGSLLGAGTAALCLMRLFSRDGFVITLRQA